jgi:macrodomain Ter protein organizer (MatP/YcbG family)
MNIQVLSEIRTRHPNKTAASDPSLRAHGHRNWLSETLYPTIIKSLRRTLFIKKKSHFAAEGKGKSSLKIMYLQRLKLLILTNKNA